MSRLIGKLNVQCEEYLTFDHGDSAYQTKCSMFYSYKDYLLFFYN